MRIRFPIAGAFVVTAAASLYLGLADVHLIHDKAAHFAAFFLLGLLFYWVFDITRRRAINISILVVTVAGGVGSEFAQAYLTDRIFDINDIVANILGSLLAITISALYHQRIMDRRRKARYDRLRQNLSDDVEAQIGPDIELQETEEPNEDLA